ncbi:MAG: hypothetical protein EHM41_01775 [Chloroflexi bacterium]|nr:MAG: hypothetical protein EHM41_01775 [Chloroflexota bacterium]
MNKALSSQELRAIPKAFQPRPWLLLPARLCLFAGFQALFALGFLTAGDSDPWDTSAIWWPFSVILANLVSLFLLIRFFRDEGNKYWDIFHFSKQHVKGDLLVVFGLVVISGPIAFLPNLALAGWLFDDPQNAMNLMVRHIPTWAALAAFIFFPVTQGMVELPYYLRYIMPRLKEQTGNALLAVSLAALGLGVQHFTMPLLFDPKFIIWRLLMFIPFAFLMAIILNWRPRLLPYFVIVHILMDMSTAVFFFTV